MLRSFARRVNNDFELWQELPGGQQVPTFCSAPSLEALRQRYPNYNVSDVERGAPAAAAGVMPVHGADVVVERESV